MLFLKPVKLECVIKMLVSSANKIGVDLLFINAGKSFIYIRKSKGPITGPCGTPCLTFSQFGGVDSFVFLLYIETLWYRSCR
jgi:hypothetical protein